MGKKHSRCNYNTKIFCLKKKMSRNYMLLQNCIGTRLLPQYFDFIFNVRKRYESAKKA